jgi:hypothetical protein
VKGDHAMSNNQINLNRVLRDDAVSQCTSAAATVARSRLAAAPSVNWVTVAGAIGDKVAEMFDIPLLDRIVDALAGDADRPAFSRGERRTVPLGGYTVEASFEPHLEITISGLPTARIDFEIVAEIEFEAIELTIEHRALRSIRLGSCRAAVKIKCQGVVVFEPKSRELELPGEIIVSAETTAGAPARSRAAAVAYPVRMAPAASWRGKSLLKRIGARLSSLAEL